jgi:hypothetical protein
MQKVLFNYNKTVDTQPKRCYNTYILKHKGHKMKDSVAMAMFVAGLVLTLLGVGGIEASMDNVGLAQGLLVSVVGLMTMGVGVLAIRVNSSTDYYN